MYDSEITPEEIRKEIDKTYHKLHLLQSLYVAKFESTQRAQRLIDQLNREEETGKMEIVKLED